MSDEGSVPPAAPELDAAAHHRLGVDLFNHVWLLIRQPHHTAAETDEMIHAAHASRYHWSKTGTTAADTWRERARGALADISDPADRELIEGDLATIPQ